MANEFERGMVCSSTFRNSDADLMAGVAVEGMALILGPFVEHVLNISSLTHYMIFHVNPVDVASIIQLVVVHILIGHQLRKEFRIILRGTRPP